MMPLGLMGSNNTDNSAIAFSRESTAKSASHNGSKADDFAKALGEEQGTNLANKKPKSTDSTDVAQRHDKQFDMKINQGDGVESKSTDGLVIATDNYKNFKSSFDTNAKQIAFVSVDGALAEKLAPVKVNASNNNMADGLLVDADSVSVDVDGARNTVNIAVENIGQSAMPIVSADGDKQSASKVLNDTQKPNAITSMKNDKVAVEKLILPDNKIKNELQNRASKSLGIKSVNDGGEIGKSIGKNITYTAASSTTSTRSNANTVAKGINGAINAEMPAKTSSDNINSELVSERAAGKIKNSRSAGSEFSAVQVRVKASNNTVNFLTESKIENLGNTLQQIVTTSESKAEAQVRTVSVPRIILPQSQSVVSQKTIEIQLLPKTLGLIQVKIEISDGKMSLTIEAQTAKAEAAIKQEIVQIVETIKAAGMSVEDVSVRRNAELSQQDQAINEFSSDANLQENFANGEFGEQFEDQKDDKNAKGLEDMNSENGAKGDRNNTRTGIYL